MPLTGHEDHRISLANAAIMTKRYRDNSPADSIIAHYLGKDAIEEILNQANCVGIRIYHALDANNVKQVVVVGVKANQDDLYNGALADNSFLCPQLCAGDNPLNSD